MPAQPWVALALVTTGLAEDTPLEVAALRFTGPEPEAQVSFLLRPPFDLPLLTQHRAGLTPADFEHAVPLADAHRELLGFLGNAPIVGDGLEQALERLALADLLFTPRCELSVLASLLMPSLADFRLSSLGRSLGLTPHAERALPLAHLTQSAFLRLWERVAGLPGALPDELARLAIRADHP